MKIIVEQYLMNVLSLILLLEFGVISNRAKESLFSCESLAYSKIIYVYFTII